MAPTATQVDIPHRALFKAAEVCELMQVPAYVLRSWEAEFPQLGVSKSGGARVYRRADVEQVARIKHLVHVEGLTLAGARRRIEEDGAPVGTDAAGIDELMGRNARERLTAVKRGLRSILDLLGEGAGKQERLHFGPAKTPATRSSASPARSSAARSKAARAKPAPRGVNRVRRKNSSRH